MIYPDFSLIFINSFNSHLLNDYWVPAVNHTLPLPKHYMEWWKGHEYYANSYLNGCLNCNCDKLHDREVQSTKKVHT